MLLYQPQIHKKFNSSKWFYIFLSLHTIAWTIVPTLVRYTLPMDAIEGFVWGQRFQFGYDRNPYLNGWLTAFATKIGGTWDLPVYFLSQLSVGLCFWAVWRLGKKFLAPIHALIAVMILEALQYYSIAAVDFDDNVLELGIWALLTLTFYNALKERKNWQFLLSAFLAGLALMTKYYALVLFIPMLVFSLVRPENRSIFRNLWFYLGLLLFFLITGPHFVWLIQNNYSTIQYTMLRIFDVVDPNTTIRHFTIMHLLALVGPLALFGILLLGRNNTQTLSPSFPKPISKYDKYFLLILGFGPILATILIATIFRMVLHVMWGMPLFYLWGIMLVALVKPKITRAKINHFLIAVFLVLGLQLGGYTYVQVYAKNNHSSANYPAKAIAQYVVQLWQNNYKSNLAYIIGDRYIAGNVAYFAKIHCPRPTVYVIGKPELNRKINHNDLQKHGAILLWESSGSNDVPANLLSEFPQAKFLENDDFSWRRNHDGTKIKIGVGVLSPE